VAYVPAAEARDDRHQVAVEDYRHYHAQGFLIVRGLVPDADVQAMLEHGMGILDGSVSLPNVPTPPPGATRDELLRRFSRIHMLHRTDAMHEQYLLHPKILDVQEALIGPDVLCLQTMLFFNAPGMGGQGWHQDSAYITVYPDTLNGAWLALDRADEENGCLWVVPGSHHEPIYPPGGESRVHAAGAFSDLERVDHISHLDDEVNTLTRVVRKYAPAIPVVLDPGDVVFFDGHLLHRSHPNRAESRWRRAFVCHYSNARSWVPWNHGAPYEGETANYLHILGRGTTHLPYSDRHFPALGTRTSSRSRRKRTSA